MKRQQGFTLIELIVVIVILGILAATALPKYADLQKDARLASIQGALGAINSAKSIAHAQWLTNSSVTSLEGITVSYTTSGYPNASSVIGLAGLAEDVSVPTLSQHYNIVISLSGVASQVTVEPKGVASPGDCTVTYWDGNQSTAPLITSVASNVAHC